MLSVEHCRKIRFVKTFFRTKEHCLTPPDSSELPHVDVFESFDTESINNKKYGPVTADDYRKLTLLKIP